jgi:aryl-alcohol dehydrogenase-like predicted oxidoreductase
MEYTAINNTNLRPSRIGLGTWAIGGSEWGGTDDFAAIATIERALDSGIVLIDTAPVYGQGHAEEVVGKALTGKRDKAIVATKVGLEWNDRGDAFRNSSPMRIRKEIDDSLRRLQTDHIDVYQVHWPDLVTPIEETARALADLRKAGKIQAIGVSNFSPQQMAEFSKYAPLHTVQPPYNLFEREAESEVLPYVKAHDLCALTYGALCRGLLSGRINEKTVFRDDDLRAGADPKFQPPRFAQYLSAVEKLDVLARERFGKRVIHLALRWVLDSPGVGVALWGARKPDQVDAIPGAFDFTIDAETRVDIECIVEQEIHDPVGPDFMAPPEEVSV